MPSKQLTILHQPKTPMVGNASLAATHNLVCSMADSRTHPFIQQMVCILAVQGMLLHPQAPKSRQERAQYSIVGAMLHRWIGRHRRMMQRISSLRWAASCLQSNWPMPHNNSASCWLHKGSEPFWCARVPMLIRLHGVWLMRGPLMQVAAHPANRAHNIVGRPIGGSHLLQIWRIGHELPNLALALCLHGGLVWDCKWQPGSGHRDR